MQTQCDSHMDNSIMITMATGTARRMVTRGEDRATPSAITVGVWSVDEAVEGGMHGVTVVIWIGVVCTDIR